MSDFISALVDLLPEHNSLKNPNNELFKVLDRSVGEWFDNIDINRFYDNLFIDTATGSFLDLFGKDYGVYRQNGETDEDYRTRIVQDKLEHLTPFYLETLFGLKLYTYVAGFKAEENCLTSDNQYIKKDYMALNNPLIPVLNQKFVLNDSIFWLDENYYCDCIINTLNTDLLPLQRKIYGLSNLVGYYGSQGGLKTVKLTLYNAVNCEKMFFMCDGLLEVNLYLPNAVNCEDMLANCLYLNDITLYLPKAENCKAMLGGVVCTDLNLDLPSAKNCNNMLGGTSLVNLVLNIPNVESYENIFYDSTNLENINVTVPANEVTDFKTYVLGLELENLTSFVINGEEVDLT